jgi:aspartyl/asparaginyl-tRNA synthetase
MEYWKLLKDRKMISSLNSKDAGKSVVVAGWVYDQRDLGKVRFLVLRDFSGDIQVTAHKDKSDKKVFDLMQKISRESSVLIQGKVQKSEKAPGGREIIPEVFEVLNEAEQPLPVDVSDFSKTELPKRLDYRYVDFHRRRTQAIFKIQHTISVSFREFFANSGFLEMQPPCLIGVASEGGADVFKVKYFEREACLAQSPQLYKEMVACSMEKTFMITPVWRAEKHNTIRHINEIRQMDTEARYERKYKGQPSEWRNHAKRQYELERIEEANLQSFWMAYPNFTGENPASISFNVAGRPVYDLFYDSTNHTSMDIALKIFESNHFKNQILPVVTQNQTV